MTGVLLVGRPLIDPTRASYRWWLLTVTSIGALLASVSSGSLVIALPAILRDLHTDLFAVMWIIVGYTLVLTVLVLNAAESPTASGGHGRSRWAARDSQLHPSSARSRRTPRA